MSEPLSPEKQAEWAQLLHAVGDVKEETPSTAISVTVTDLIECLEEASVLLAEVHLRFGAPHVLDPNMHLPGGSTFLDFARMYNSFASRARSQGLEGK